MAMDNKGATSHVRDGDGVTGVALLFMKLLGRGRPGAWRQGRSTRSGAAARPPRGAAPSASAAARLPLLPGVAELDDKARVRASRQGAVHAISASGRGGATADAAPAARRRRQGARARAHPRVRRRAGGGGVGGGGATALPVVGAPGNPSTTLLVSPSPATPAPSRCGRSSGTATSRRHRASAGRPSIRAHTIAWCTPVPPPVGTDENVTLCEIHRDGDADGGELRVEPLLCAGRSSHGNGRSTTRSRVPREPPTDGGRVRARRPGALRRHRRRPAPLLPLVTSMRVALWRRSRRGTAPPSARARSTTTSTAPARHYSLQQKSARRPRRRPPPRPTTKPRDGDDSLSGCPAPGGRRCVKRWRAPAPSS